MKKYTTLETALFVLLAFSIIFFVFLVPPFQKPDEEVHFYRALNLASGNVFCTKARGNTLKIHSQYVEFVDKIHKMDLPLHKNNKFDISLYSKSQTIPLNSKIYNIDYQCSFPLISYIPQTVGVLIGSALSLGAVQIFFLGRFVLALIVFVWMFVLYKKCIKELRPLLTLVYFTPVFLQQVTSYGYDAINLLAAVTFFVLVSQYSKNMLALLLSLLLVFITKPGGYEPLIFLIFLIPYQTYSKSKLSYVKKIVMFLFILGISYAAAKSNMWSAYKGIEQLRTDISPLANALALTSNPLNSLLLIIRTTIDRGPFYIQSTIGILGWLEYSVGLLGYATYGLLLVYVLVTTKIPQALLYTKKQIIYGSSFIGGYYVFFLALYYVIWNPADTLIIDGIQGRYFLPLLPFFYLTLIQLRHITAPKFNLSSRPAAMLLLAFFMILVTMFAIFSRYY
ncbi:MAG: DUF2142 domain-containing protein [Patescibacteria group bacterium]|jgi:uncharacterized membrane protein